MLNYKHTYIAHRKQLAYVKLHKIFFISKVEYSDRKHVYKTLERCMKTEWMLNILNFRR